jgi:hypothetical protein
MISGNVAAGKAASAFSTVGRGIAARAVDGQDSAEEHVQHGSCYLPQRTWWPTPKFLTIDLGAIYDITIVNIKINHGMCHLWMIVGWMIWVCVECYASHVNYISVKYITALTNTLRIFFMKF